MNRQAKYLSPDREQQMPHKTLVALLCLVLSGCCNSSAPTPSQHWTPPESKWPADFTPDQAVRLAPDECKAILVARAALESKQGREIHAHFSIQHNGEGWTVTAFYTARPGEAVSVGAFTAVTIAPDWSVKSIVGGA